MTFSELIRSDKPVLIDFSAEWCGPCKMLAPVLEQVKRQIGDEATIVKLDVDKNQAVAASYNVMAVPTLILFKKGKPVWRHAGLTGAADLVAVIQQNK